MSKFKVGDEVVLVDADDTDKAKGFKNGGVFIIGSIYEDLIELKNGGLLYSNQVKLASKYYGFKTSNRYKMHKYILSTGFTKQDLSLALNKNQSYLTTETRESQFINRGDMSDARYKSLRKQIKEAVQIKSEPIDISMVAGEVTQTLVEIKPQEKTLDKKVKEAKEALDTFTAPKPSNNGAFILGLVFFVLLIIFGIGCLIYKAA